MQIDSRPTFNVASQLMAKVADLYEIDPWDVPRSGNKRRLHRQRWAVIWVLRQFGDRDSRGHIHYTYQRLANLLGFDDHSSVWHGERRAEELRKTDAKFRRITDELMAFAMAVEPRTKLAA